MVLHFRDTALMLAHGGLFPFNKRGDRFCRISHIKIHLELRHPHSFLFRWCAVGTPNNKRIYFFYWGKYCNFVTITT